MIKVKLLLLLLTGANSLCFFCTATLKYRYGNHSSSRKKAVMEYVVKQPCLFDHILHISCIRYPKLWLVRLIFAFWHYWANKSIFELHHLVSELLFSHPVAESDSPSRGKSSGQQAIFRVNVTLSIPNIAMVPALEEVQQALNRAVECVVSVSKGVSQWSKERISKVCLIWWQKQ